METLLYDPNLSLFCVTPAAKPHLPNTSLYRTHRSISVFVCFSLLSSVSASLLEKLSKKTLSLLHSSPTYCFLQTGKCFVVCGNDPVLSSLFFLFFFSCKIRYLSNGIGIKVLVLRIAWGHAKKEKIPKIDSRKGEETISSIL